MIDKATVDRIYAAADVVDVINDFITLKKKGVNYQACCPFHNEKTPSFVVSPAKGLFKCFGCGKGGNAVTFVMEHENMSYVDALKFVAKKYSIDVQEREMTPEEARKNDDRESMMVATSYASEYFRDQLSNSTEGKSIGLSYFRQRGFSDATIAKFELGYCPSAGDAFSKSALAAGYKEEFLTGAGLTIKKEQGGYYDRFAGRVMFPIHTISGRVTAFGGRTMRTDKNVAKYLNSPESEIYHKSNILYGLFYAKKAITHDDCCILVEGYTDVISMHQSGVENVVSSSGTSLTTDQIRLIGRFTKNITVIYDGDSAGIKASLRGIDMILKEGLNVRVVLLPEGDDPDSFARKRNATQLKEFIREAEEDFLTFKIKILLQDSGNDPIKKSAVITDIVASIAEIPTAINRSVYTKECSRLLEVDEQVLISEVARKRMSYGADDQTRQFIRNQQQQVRQEQIYTPTSESTLSIEPGSSIGELERELLKYLLKYGDKNFEYIEGSTVATVGVAQVIISDLQANEIEFQEEIFRDVYNTFVSLYGDAAMSGKPFQIEMHNFINHSKPAVCNFAVDIMTCDDNYIVSKMWLKHDVVVVLEEGRLAEAVPRTVTLYKSKAIDNIISKIHLSLSQDGITEERERELITRITKLNEERNRISKKLSRLIL